MTINKELVVILKQCSQSITCNWHSISWIRCCSFFYYNLSISYNCLPSDKPICKLLHHIQKRRRHCHFTYIWYVWPHKPTSSLVYPYFPFTYKILFENLKIIIFQDHIFLAHLKTDILGLKMRSHLGIENQLLTGHHFIQLILDFQYLIY